jgi:hypothetical protein
VAIHQPRSDKVSLIAKDLGWPYECPNENNENERQRIEDIEPELDGPQYSIVSLRELDDSERTSDLGVSLISADCPSAD